jgi:Domain of unknown function (DUF4424)
MRYFLAAQFLAHTIGMGIVGFAHANDSSAQMRAGGLVLQRTNAVSMVSEDLFVSREKIKVRYLYRNVTRQPVTLTITFPLPDRVPFEGSERSVTIDDGSPDFVGFTTKVNGRAVPLTSNQQALVGQRDVTALLQSVRLLVAPDVGDVSDRIERLSSAQKSRLKQGGALDADDQPQWTLKTNFVRQQTFPVGRDVIVEHEYAASEGGSVGTPLTSRDVDVETLRDYRTTYCVDDAFLRAARAMGARESRGSGSVQEVWVSYVLKTGANWAGPIGRFRLVVDKGDTEALVSFCGQNVTKISPTQFEMVRTNWRPDKDLDLLFLLPMRPAAGE